jgi:hypothetical protein
VLGEARPAVHEEVSASLAESRRLSLLVVQFHRTKHDPFAALLSKSSVLVGFRGSYCWEDVMTTVEIQSELMISESRTGGVAFELLFLEAFPKEAFD